MKYHLWGMLCTVEPKRMHGASPGTLAYGIGQKDGERKIVFFYQDDQSVERIGSLDEALQSQHKDHVDSALEEGPTVRGDFSHYFLYLNGGNLTVDVLYTLGDEVFQKLRIKEEEHPTWVKIFEPQMLNESSRYIVLNPKGSPVVVKEFDPAS